MHSAIDAVMFASALASFCCTSWNDAIGLPNCTRVFA